jgi:hypothetical protein
LRLPCRLLFHRIRPVFVFDGATPALKKQTTAARRRRREQQHAKLRKTAEKLLMNQLKQHALGKVTEAQLRQAAAGGRQGPAGANGRTGAVSRDAGQQAQQRGVPLQEQRAEQEQQQGAEIVDLVGGQEEEEEEEEAAAAAAARARKGKAPAVDQDPADGGGQPVLAPAPHRPTRAGEGPSTGGAVPAAAAARTSAADELLAAQAAAAGWAAGDDAAAAVAAAQAAGAGALSAFLSRSQERHQQRRRVQAGGASASSEDDSDEGELEIVVPEVEPAAAYPHVSPHTQLPASQPTCLHSFALFAPFPPPRCRASGWTRRCCRGCPPPWPCS